MAFIKPRLLLLFVVVVVVVATDQTDQCGQPQTVAGNVAVRFPYSNNTTYYYLWYRTLEVNTVTHITLKSREGSEPLPYRINPITTSNTQHFWRIKMHRHKKTNILEVSGEGMEEMMKAETSTLLEVVEVESNKPVVWINCTNNRVIALPLNLSTPPTSQDCPSGPLETTAPALPLDLSTPPTSQDFLSGLSTTTALSVVVVVVVVLVVLLVATCIGMFHYRRGVALEKASGNSGPTRYIHRDHETSDHEIRGNSGTSKKDNMTGPTRSIHRDQETRDQEDVYHIYDEWNPNYAAEPISRRDSVNSLYQPMTP